MKQRKENPAGNRVYKNTICRTHNTPSFVEINTVVLSAGLPLSWYPNGRRYGTSLRIGNLAGDKGASLWICLRTGAWKDHATGESGGDLVSLYAAMQGIGQGEALKQLAEFLGHSSREYIAPVRRTEQPDKEQAQKTERARKLWNESRLITETPAAQYLRSRGITMPLPSTLRFHPAAYHWPTKKTYPALVAAVTVWPSREINAVHMTFLDGVQKADIPKNKLRLASAPGGAIRLAPSGDVLTLAEGIETALSLQQATGMTAWAVLSTGNYKRLILPDTTEKIIIAADHDEHNAGLIAAREAADIWVRQGLEVHISLPPEPGTDFNDLIQEASQ